MNNKTGWKLEESYKELPEIFYKMVEPNRVSSPSLYISNDKLARELGLDPEELKEEENIELLAGNRAPSGDKLLAQAYAGHQFGNFTMLGDGRALLLGEQISPEGKRYDIQLKGAGRTPFSRGGDGRATFSSMLREYLVSEAMQGLGIATSRSLALVKTGDRVLRNKTFEGAVLTRVAKSHIRFGTFQYALAYGEKDDLAALADYAIDRHYPEIKDDERPYLSLLKQVVKVQAKLIAKWKAVGFIHGVMNTDNMTISGETIDYGPCAFMDNYHPDRVFSSIDRTGRYSYDNQSRVGQWNLSRFAETLLVLIDEDKEKAVELAEEAIREFSPIYQREWLEAMGRKLGIREVKDGDRPLVEDLLELMKDKEADFTNSFIGLTLDKYEELELFKGEDFKAWKDRWEERLREQGLDREEVRNLMKENNPYIIPRNHLVEEVLHLAENGDKRAFEDYLQALSKPYAYEESQDKYAKLPPESAKNHVTYCGT